MYPSLTQAFVATSLRDEDSAVRDWFCDILRSLGIEPHVGDEPDTKSIPEKILLEIGERPAFVALLTKRHQMSDGSWRPPEWIQNEIGIAYSKQRRIAAFVEEGVDVEGILPQITTYVRFDRMKLLESMPKITTLVLKLHGDLLEGLRMFSYMNARTLVLALQALRIRFAQFLNMKKVDICASNNEIKIAKIHKKGDKFMVVIKGGLDKGIFKGLKLKAWTRRTDIDTPLEEEFATLEVYHVQPKISQARILVQDENPAWERIGANEGLIEAPDNVVRVVLPEGANQMKSESLEEVIRVLKDITEQVEKEFERNIGDILG